MTAVMVIMGAVMICLELNKISCSLGRIADALEKPDEEVVPKERIEVC